VLSEYNS